jgi:2-phospho-L-lactate guanylyltransferase
MTCVQLPPTMPRRAPSVVAASSIHALVPVKALERAKSRLAGVLDPAQRRVLVIEMLQQVLRTLGAFQPHASVHESSLAVVWVVASDQSILDQAATFGARPLVDRAVGLNPALDLARAAATAAGADGLLVVPADVPLISVSDVQSLIRSVRSGADVTIAGDTSGQGTNALALRLPSPLRFRFGVGSFARHCADAERLGLQVATYESPTLALDVDDGESFQRYRDAREPIV